MGMRNRMDNIKKWREEFLAYVSGLNLPRDDYRGFVAYMDEALTIEPEIIRCKDCKRQDTDNAFRSMWCYEMRTFVKPNEFCSRGERRTDERGHHIQGGCN